MSHPNATIKSVTSVHQFNGAHWTNDSGRKDYSFSGTDASVASEWTGVALSAEAQVTALYQNGSELSGSIPTEIVLFRKGWRTINHA